MHNKIANIELATQFADDTSLLLFIDNKAIFYTAELFLNYTTELYHSNFLHINHSKFQFIWFVNSNLPEPEISSPAEQIQFLETFIPVVTEVKLLGIIINAELS